MSTHVTATERENAIDQLHRFAPKGSTIYAVLRSVAPSGMSRRIDFYVITKRVDKRQDLQYLTGWMATLGLGSLSPDGSKRGMLVKGCGFHVVYELSHALYGDADALRNEWI